MAGLSDAAIYNNFKQIASEMMSIATFLMTTIATTMAQSMTVNLQMGFNALRCAFASGFINVWMLMASLYFFAR